MMIILLAILAILVSNTIKFVVFLRSGGTLSRSSFFWHYLWTGKFPSSHSAAFGSAVASLWYTEGFTSLVAFSIIVAVFVMYTLFENKKRYELFAEYYMQSSDEAIKLLVTEKKIAEFEGHTMTEVIGGLLVGIATALTALYFLV